MVRRLRPAGPERCGAALVLVVLLLLALTLLGHGLLVLAESEGRASASGGAALSERLVARAALEAGVEHLQKWDSLPRLAPGARMELAGIGPGRVELEGASREVVLLQGMAEGAANRALVTTLWGLDPVARAAGVEAVVEAGGSISASFGTIRAADYWGATEGGACGAFEAAMDTLRARAGPPRRESRLNALGPEGDLLPHPVAARTLGLLPPDSLVRRLPSVPSEIISPRPVVDGLTCVADPSNWGDPTEPAGPCGRRWVARRSPGALEVRAGEGQGLLLVDGDLTLTGGTHLAGLVLVAGDLVVSGSSTLEGVARVGGSVRLEDGSHVVGRACPVIRALHGVSSLRRPLRIPEPPALFH